MMPLFCVLTVNKPHFYFYWTRVRSWGMLVTNSLTHCRLVNFIDVSLACEDGNSKLVEVAFLYWNQIVYPYYSW